MNHTSIPLDIEGVRRFHGHSCPGLATGIRVAEIALREIGSHSADEEIVCITETDNCSVDAIQYLTGCTAGKGNLIHLDHGKNVFTFIRRSDGKAVRVARRQSDRSDPAVDQSWEARIQAILDAPLEELFEVREVDIDMPDKARILRSIVCTECGEATMSTRVHFFRGQPYCIPCFNALTQE